MIPKECKRLAEVDFPIAVVSKHSAREKSIRHGHPSTLHLWWARRPLAACRAMLLGLLLPDPGDPHCPAEFKTKARALLARTQGHIDADDVGLRKALLGFIGDFAAWEMSSNPEYLEIGRGLVKAAHPEETPLVVDPFAGGGSIPLEALRLGCEAFASDLNPVACLILKVMLEDIPRHGPELAKELRRVGGEIKKKAEKELAEFYPKDPDGATPIAYLWARTVRCESPGCGAEIPLARSFWLCKKANRKRALRYSVVRPKGQPPRVEFEIFEPESEKEVPPGTVSRAKASCPACGMVLPPNRVRAQLREQRGGADVIFDAKGNRTGGARMLAVVTLHPAVPGRNYRVPTDRDYQAIWKAQKRLKTILGEWERGGQKELCPIPNEPLPPHNTNCFRVPNYGVRHWGELFNARQLMTNREIARTIDGCSGKKANGMREVLALCLDKSIDLGNAFARWKLDAECPVNLFARQAISMVWDFAEAVLIESSSGSFDSSVDRTAHTIAQCYFKSTSSAQIQIADARRSPLPDLSCQVWFTDPPYYDAIGYAELSDFFFVWLRRSLSGHAHLRDPFDHENDLTPKRQEAVQDEKYESEDGTPKTREFFEQSMARAFEEGRRVLSEDGVGSVVFAHKTTEGWEALLSGMIQGGLVITGSWPIATEMGSRLRARDSAALATSVHLVCRPRPDDAPVGDWGDVLRELPKRVGDWMERLQGEGIRGADLVFACIGPALEIYSRYSRVEDADDREIPLGGDPMADEPHERGFLAYVWETVGRLALEQVLGTAEAKARNGAAGAVEEDARLTALFLWTLQSTDGDTSPDQASRDREGAEEKESKTKPKGFSLPFDVVRRFAQPLGIHLDVWEDRIIETKKGVVRLLPVAERARGLFGAAARPGARSKATRWGRVRRGSAGPPRGDDARPGPCGHALLQSAGRANALRALLAAEMDRSPDFLRLANALSALYPKGSEEKRLVDAMLLAVPR